MDVTAQDLDTLARTLYGESRGESWLGKVAVAWVIWNRVKTPKRRRWWGDTIHEVCTYPMQFTCWNRDDPNRPKMERLTLKADPAFRECLAAGAAAISGLEPDPTEKATHYYVAMSPEPRWARGIEPIAEVGRHLFFRVR